MSKRVHELKSAEDYQRWSLTHKAYMQSEGLWLYCLPAPLPSSSSPYLLPEPDAEKDLKGWQEWQLNVQKAVGKTQLTLSRNITLTAAHADHPVHLLAHLKTLFAGSSMSDVLTLHDRYSSLRCATGQAVQYLTDMAELRSQLAGLGDVVSDDKHALSVVQGLKDGPYDDLRRRLVDLLHLEPDRFSYAVVERMLLARSREEEAERVDQALAARMGAMRVTPHGQGRQQHQRSSGSQAQAGGASLAGSGRCFNCLQFGHFKVNCQNPSSTVIPAGHETKDAYRTRAAARQQAREGARASMAVVAGDVDSSDSEYHVVSSAASSSGEEAALRATSEVVMAAVADGTTYIDSGCSRSMFGAVDWFKTTSYKEDKRKIFLGDGRYIESVGSGTVEMQAGSHLVVLKDCLHVPSLAGNLLSVAHLVASGVRCAFDARGCVVERAGHIVAVVPARSSMYAWDVLPALAMSALVVSGAAIDEELAHRRLGHVGVGRVRRTAAQVDGLELTSEEMLACDACVEGKMTRRTFKMASAPRSSRPGDVVSADLFGPLPVTASGHRFGLVIIDDASSLIKLYLLKRKGDALGCFERFVVEAETFGHRVRVLRSDNGGEFVSAAFDAFLAGKGIGRALTSPHTPEQNGQAERAVRTIKEGMRTALLQAGLGQSFWGRAARSFVYARNRSSVRGLIPFEAWTGKTASVSHLRVWGCLAWVHIPAADRLNVLSAKAVRGVFVGYGDDEGGAMSSWSVWIPSQQRVVRSATVAFVEDQFWPGDDRQGGDELVWVEMKGPVEVSTVGGSKAVGESEERTPSAFPHGEGDTPDGELDGPAADDDGDNDDAGYPTGGGGPTAVSASVDEGSEAVGWEGPADDNGTHSECVPVRAERAPSAFGNAPGVRAAPATQPTSGEVLSEDEIDDLPHAPDGPGVLSEDEVIGEGPAPRASRARGEGGEAVVAGDGGRLRTATNEGECTRQATRGLAVDPQQAGRAPPVAREDAPEGRSAGAAGGVREERRESAVARRHPARARQKPARFRTSETGLRTLVEDESESEEDPVDEGGEWLKVVGRWSEQAEEGGVGVGGQPSAAILLALFAGTEHAQPVSFDGPCVAALVMALAAAHQEGVPERLAEALRGPNGPSWRAGAELEMASLHKHKVWTLVPRPQGVNIVGCRDVLAEKKDAQGVTVRYKVRFVAQGYSQVEGKDYFADETFSPVVKLTTLRLLLAEAASRDWEVHQMDVETAYLYGELQEEVYMSQPPGFEEHGKEDWVCRLHKGLYGLKQAARQWYLKLHEALTSIGFERSTADQGLYSLRWAGEELHLAVYVDDFGLFASGVKILSEVKARIASAFTVKDLGEMRFCLGIEVVRDRAQRTLQISQRPYVEHLAAKYHMTSPHPVAIPLDPSLVLRKAQSPQTEDERREMAGVPYAQLLGGLLWVMLVTRPDLSFAVVRLAQFAACPGKTHWSALKRVLAYLVTTKGWALTYGAGEKSGSTFEVYSDADYASADVDGRRSHSAYVSMLNGGAISWASKKQESVVLSTCEAEYVALAHAVKETIWLRSVLASLRVLPPGPTTVYEDNRGARALAMNPNSHARSKHIDIRHHFTRDKVEDGTIAVVSMPTHQMLADLGTKLLGRVKHQFFSFGMGLRGLGLASSQPELEGAEGADVEARREGVLEMRRARREAQRERRQQAAARALVATDAAVAAARLPMRF